MIKILALTLICTFSLYASTYDDNYNLVEAKKSANDNTFMSGDFDEIIRFDMLKFTHDGMDKYSEKNLDKIVKEIKTYTNNNKVIKVTLIGHSDRPTDDINENKIDSDTYANRIQNIFKYSLSENNASSYSENYAKLIEANLLDNNISKEIISVEHRGGKDLLFSDSTDEERELSNRVMVTMYVEKPLDIDSDRDGVFDNYDLCPNTPRQSKVDKNGCPIDSDRDGIVDYKDRCPKTPQGVLTDTRGCPLDMDGDGIVDYKDKCLNTMSGLKVDPNGCPLKSTLKLNFKPASAKILSESNSEIKAFAEFMKENELYRVKIVGHTDSIGKAVTNMTLSQERALSVKKALVAEGVAASRLSTSGRGELDPIESNRLKEGRSANRRIEVELFY